MNENRQYGGEYALGQFASHISVLSAPLLASRDTSASTTATKEEAQLLMNLLSPVPRRNTTNGENGNNPHYSPVCNYGTGEFHGTVFRRFNKQDDDMFSFSCPSLSLGCDQFSTVSPDCEQRLVTPAESDIVPPSPSMNAKVQSGAQEQPMLDLGKLLERQLSENRKWGDVESQASELTENIRSTFEYVIDSRIQTWKSSLSRVINLRVQQELANANVTESKEEKVLESLSRVSTKLSVSKVSTTFRSLREEQSDKSIQVNLGTAIVSPAPKKKPRTHTGKSEMSRPLEFTVTMDISPYDLTLLLHAPGTITGTFNDDLDDSKLTGMDVNLDMNVLVDSIRKQSRYVARKAAEAELIELAKVITTAVTANASSSSLKFMEQKANGKAYNEKSTTTCMPPPPPRSSARVHPGIVSPSPGSPTSFVPGTPTLPPSVMAPFVSPTPNSKRSSIPPFIKDIMDKHSTDSTYTSAMDRCPLPALVEVACASFAAEKGDFSHTLR